MKSGKSKAMQEKNIYQGYMVWMENPLLGITDHCASTLTFTVHNPLNRQTKNIQQIQQLF